MKTTKLGDNQFYISVNKPKGIETKHTLNELVVGDNLAKECKASGVVKLRKTDSDITRLQKNSTYTLYKRLVKEKNSKWLIISKIELNANSIKHAVIFKEITNITYRDLTKSDGKRPFRTKHFIYIITF